MHFRFSIYLFLIVLFIACNNSQDDVNSTLVENSTPVLIEQTSDLSTYSVFLDYGIHQAIGGTRGQTQPSPYIRQMANISKDEYAKYSTQLSADQWNADDLVIQLKSLGIQKVIFPAKNIDGFTMFDSQYSAFKSTKDLVSELASACQNANIEFGLLYSLVDWNIKEPNGAGHHADLISEEEMTVIQGQIQELFSNYGSIDHIVFKHGSPTPEQCVQIQEAIKSLQPACAISGLQAAYNDLIVMNRPLFIEKRFDLPWTYFCPLDPPNSLLTADNNDVTRFHIRNLLETIASGGTITFELPMTTGGTISEKDQRSLEAIGNWINGKSALVYNSERTPFGIKSWGTVMGEPTNHRLFINIINWPDDGQINLYGLNNDINAIYPLGDNSQQLPFSKNGRNLIIHLEGQFSKEHDISIIVFEYVGTLNVTPLKQAYASGGSWSLTSKNAVISHTISGENEYASAPAPNTFTWYLPPTSGGTYNLTCKYTRHEVDQEIDLLINGQPYTLTLDNTQQAERPEAFQVIYGAFFQGVPSLANELFTTRHGPTKGFPKGQPWGFNSEITWSEQSDWNNGDTRNIDAPPMSSTYVYQSMYVEADQTMLSSFQPDDGLTVWSNGDLVAEFLNTGQKDEILLEIPTRSGNNQMMYKFYNTRGDHTISIEHNVLAAQYIKSLDNPISLTAGQITTIQVKRHDDLSEKLDLINFSISIAPVSQM